MRRKSADDSKAKTGVCLRTGQGTFRVYPDTEYLDDFEAAIRQLNPEVAVKVTNATVQAALSKVRREETVLFIDSENRIQILPTIAAVAFADKGQGAAFVYDERMLVVWADEVDDIVPAVKDFNVRLLALVWGHRPGSVSKFSDTTAESSHSDSDEGGSEKHEESDAASHGVVDASDSVSSLGKDVDEKKQGETAIDTLDIAALEDGAGIRKRRVMRFEAPIFMGLATGLSILFVIIGASRIIEEVVVDGNYVRFALLAFAPLLFCVSLFFTQTLVNSVFYIVGPVSQFYDNSKYYSGMPPEEVKMDGLPHVTIQMPVYKESLEATIMPSINSIQKAMISYSRQGGSSSIFVNDDGMQLLAPTLREERMRFYENRNIGWVARPAHGENGFIRAGRFKKASNMNYGLSLALRMEEILEELMGDAKRVADLGIDLSDPYIDEEAALAGKALELAVDETNGEAWAAGGKSLRIGEIILLVDSDTQVPEDCLRDAARELAVSPEVAILQHGSDVLQVAHHYFENITAYFTRRVNQAIAMACANGDVAPFVGHNAFLRWRAMQEVAFVDPADGKRKIWSEANVSEDFDLSFRLQAIGYTVRWATYSKGGFKEGVSLTCDDEMNRWQKYAYGASELMFNPLVQWLRKGPINHQFHKFMWSRVPFYYKMSLMAYLFSYYGIAGSFLISVLNYVLLGFTIPVDNYYIKGFELFLACSILFFVAGNFAHAIFEYRLNIKGLTDSLVSNFQWLPFFIVFFQGLSLSLSFSILAHLFSYNISWSATVKEVESSNFFKEVPRIWRRFWPTFALCGALIGGMIVLSTSLVPRGFVVNGKTWAVIVPLAMQSGAHILFPIVLNPWLVIFSY
ncbi:hypothetical protein AURDEDRAFT_92601 [Auricularia subglabra TFB-10046 SS5]|uniref:Uncharacterized protein n=1 Tax=Auricularia subglabra (strain TFB-10046 / SS5) TaxID=717982 RepID=J0D9Z4_AURST|nr:hypothetical protein AURDEDRAFT_92601 [Auricularia subglabra TFB-10046 SS5]